MPGFAYRTRERGSTPAERVVFDQRGGRYWSELDLALASARLVAYAQRHWLPCEWNGDMQREALERAAHGRGAR